MGDSQQMHNHTAGKAHTHAAGETHTHAHNAGDAHTHDGAVPAPGTADNTHAAHTHTHDSEADNTHAAYSHTHDSETQKHMHAHNHPNQKAVSNRLARAIGHLEAVKRMVDNGEDCAQILIQLAAVRSAINNAGKVLLTDHIDHCIVEAVEDGDMQKIEELNEAIKKFI